MYLGCEKCKHWSKETMINVDGGVICQCQADGNKYANYIFGSDNQYCEEFEVIEPELYEVECGWQTIGLGVCPYTDQGSVLSGKWKTLVGKRTKLTIEVLED